MFMQYVFLCCDLQIRLLLNWPCIFRSPCVCIFWRINSEFICSLCLVRSWATRIWESRVTIVLDVCMCVCMYVRALLRLGTNQGRSQHGWRTSHARLMQIVRKNNMQVVYIRDGSSIKAAGPQPSQKNSAT